MLKELSPRELQQISKIRLTVKQIFSQLGELCPTGSLRQNAGECGLMPQVESYLVHGRRQTFWPIDSVEIIREHIERKRAGRENHARRD